MPCAATGALDQAAVRHLRAERIGHGVRAAEDPRASGTTLPREYDLAASRAGLTKEDLTAIARHSLAASFL